MLQLGNQGLGRFPSSIITIVSCTVCKVYPGVGSTCPPPHLYIFTGNSTDTAVLGKDNQYVHQAIGGGRASSH